MGVERMIGRWLARSILRDVPWDKCPASFDADMRERWLTACCRSNGCSEGTTRKVVAEWNKQAGGAD